MKLPRRHFLALAAGAAALPALPRLVRAADYPSRPVHLIVGFPPGSGPDIVARLAAQALSPRIGQEVVVDNRPGAAGNIAAEVAAKAAADGYTLFLAVSANAINASIYTSLNVDFARDLPPTPSRQSRAPSKSSASTRRTAPGSSRSRWSEDGSVARNRGRIR